MIISTLSPETLGAHPVFPPFIVRKPPRAVAVCCCQSGGLCTNNTLGIGDGPKRVMRRESWVHPVTRESPSTFGEGLCSLSRVGAGEGIIHLEEVQPVEFLAKGPEVFQKLDGEGELGRGGSGTNGTFW